MLGDRHTRATTPLPTDYVAEALDALRVGDFALARTRIQTYTATHPRELPHYLIEGLAALAMADWASARDLFSAATDAFPEHPQLWFNRGLAEENLGKPTEAEASYQASLRLKPDQGEIFGNLSNIYRKQGKFVQAVQMACRAIAGGVPKAQALNVLGLALGKMGNFSEAEKAFDEALGILGGDAAMLANRANLAVDQLKFDEAWKFFGMARTFDDSAVIRRDEGMARLLAGDYEAGLPLYEARLELPNALRVKPACPRWQGENLAGKNLLLVSEQGFGDTIQFSRYAKPLEEAGAELIWLVRQPLQRLLAANLPGQVVVEGGALPVADFWLPILSLPFALRIDSQPLPKSSVILSSDLPRLPEVKAKRKIGLVWGGSATHERDHERSIPLAKLSPLWEKIDAQFFAPFRGAEESLIHSTFMPVPAEVRDGLLTEVAVGSQLSGGGGRSLPPIIPLDPLITDFADMATLLKQLDCLITVDTAAAHLAGAMGVKTYLLLPSCPDWRWGVSGSTTSWYESVTLLRQERYGDWESVIGKLVATLTAQKTVLADGPPP